MSKASEFKPKIIVRDINTESWVARIGYITPNYVVPVPMNQAYALGEKGVVDVAIQKLKLKLIEDIINCEVIYE
ncbi:MAG: hypothetical protein ACK5RO_10765 [Pseudobdellovibrionaceae bacterium]